MQNLNLKLQSEKDKARLEVKERLHKLALKLIEFVEKLPDDNVSKIMADQLLRSATTLVAVYTHSQSRTGAGNAARHVDTCLKSAAEAKVLLMLLRDSKRAAANEIAWFLLELDDVAKIVALKTRTAKDQE
jgi:four helix bundle protein